MKIDAIPQIIRHRQAGRTVQEIQRLTGCTLTQIKQVLAQHLGEQPRKRRTP